MTLSRGAVLVLLCATTFVWALAGAHNTAARVMLASMACAAVLGYVLKDLTHVWLWLCVGLTLWFIFGQWTSWGLNPNMLACAVAIVSAAAVCYQIWWFVPIGILGLILTGSRGAILAFFLGFAALVSGRTAAIAAMVIALVVVGVYSIGRTDSMYHRLGIWNDALLHLSVWGSGFGSFADAYAAFPRRTNTFGQMAPAAYNDYLQLIFELGLGALPLFFAIALALEGDGPRLPIIVFLFLGLTYFPLYIPGVAHIALVAIGHASRRVPCRQDGDLLLRIT